jgi:hypothetical protein
MAPLKFSFLSIFETLNFKLHHLHHFINSPAAKYIHLSTIKKRCFYFTFFYPKNYIYETFCIITIFLFLYIFFYIVKLFLLFMLSYFDFLFICYLYKGASNISLFTVFFLATVFLPAFIYFRNFFFFFTIIMLFAFSNLYSFKYI